MDQSIKKLRARWLLTTTIYIVVVAAGYFILQPFWAGNISRRWMGGALSALAIHLGILCWGLRLNHRPTEIALLPTLGYGNAITLMRGLATGLLAGFLFVPRPPELIAWLPTLLYTSAIIFDYVDGYVARITNHATKLGEMLDMEFDGLAILVGIAVCIHYRQMPAWYLLLGLGRPIFIFGLWIRQQLGLPIYEMTESNNRRLIAGIQMGFLSVMLWPIFEPPVTTLACILFAIPLAGSFLRDWLIVSGQLEPESERYLRWHGVAKKSVELWIPMALRIIGFCAFVFLYANERSTMAVEWGNHLRNSAPLLSSWFPSWLLWVSPVAALTFFLGIVGRTSSLVLTCVAALNAVAAGVGFAEGSLLISTLWVLQFGGGSMALWSIEEKVLGQRAGIK